MTVVGERAKDRRRRRKCADGEAGVQGATGCAHGGWVPTLWRPALCERRPHGRAKRTSSAERTDGSEANRLFGLCTGSADAEFTVGTTAVPKEPGNAERQRGKLSRLARQPARSTPAPPGQVTEGVGPARQQICSSPKLTESLLILDLLQSSIQRITGAGPRTG